jgi:hypothetical protein
MVLVRLGCNMGFRHATLEERDGNFGDLRSGAKRWKTGHCQIEDHQDLAGKARERSSAGKAA